MSAGTRVEHSRVAKRKPTRAELRERRADLPDAGVYGLVAEDREAASWESYFVFFANSPDEARARIQNARFHKKQIRLQWGPGEAPPGRADRRPEPPPGLGPGDERWYKSREDDEGWTPWEALPRDYVHPPQG